VEELTFLGAARTVTGSKYLLDHGGRRVLVDCGLFQGLKELRLRNWDDCPVPPDSIDALVLMHAHPDHVGYLPRLVAQGYRGRIVLHRRHGRPVPVGAAGCRPHPGRRCAPGQQARLHETSPGAAAVHRGRRAFTQLQPLGYERPIEVALGWDAQTSAHAERIEI
jgi:glyoxylase-like metal-dependent hydrolase (beta-lactamase superfamily II)